MTNSFSSIPWHEVAAVAIRTTSDGPFGEDVFWDFLVNDRIVEVPGSRVHGAELDELSARLPGRLDYGQLMLSLGSTTDRIFRVWNREQPRGRMDEAALAARFGALIDRLGGGSAAGVFDRIHSAWRSPQRSYHGLDHLIDCLAELDAAAVSRSDAELAELALWYHDVVYEPGALDCEERSAQALLADAGVLGVPAATAATAADLVRATAHSRAFTFWNTEVADLVVDIDRAILGRDPLRFMEYECAIEEEFSALSRLAFRFGRGQFLAGLLARPRIYQTEHFRTRYEARARTQLTALLASPRYRSYRWLRWVPGLIPKLA
jgi:predicted metal-dependent HD superfamily phosphohydrolase